MTYIFNSTNKLYVNSIYFIFFFFLYIFFFSPFSFLDLGNTHGGSNESILARVLCKW